MDQNLVNRGVFGEQDARDEIVGVIERGDAKLVDLVQMLGEKLTVEDQKQRSDATELLTRVLGLLSKSRLQKQQIQVVTGFLSDRLDDEASLKQVCEGLTAVVEMDNFSVTNVEVLVDSLTESVDMRKHSQTVRYSVFCVVQALLTKCLDRCVKLSAKFIKMYVELTSGEKDPRNLLISFAISHTILTQLDVAKHVEELFDVTFCYFPITFEPPKDDPYGITSQDLKRALRKSIAANGVFAKDAFSGLVEKLNSSVDSVKRDTLETILACLENYNQQSIEKEWQEVWDGVKYEVLHGSDDEQDENVELALRVLRQLGGRVSLVESVKKETDEKLHDPSNKLCLPAAKLVTAVAQSSNESFTELSEFVVPRMLSQFDQSPTVAVQRTILEVLILVLAASQDYNLTIYKDQIIGSLSRALMGSAKNEISLRKIAIKGFEVVCKLDKFATKEEIGMIVQHLNDTVLNDDNDELVHSSLLALSNISDRYPDVIIEISFPAFLSQLPDENLSTVTRQPKDKDFVLSALASISLSPQLFETLQTRLLNKLNQVVNDPDYSYPLAIVSTFLAVVHKLENKPALKTYINTLGVPLINCVIGSEGHQLHDAVVNATGHVVEALVRELNPEEQALWATRLTDALVHGKANGINSLEVFDSPTNLAQLLTLGLAPISAKVPVDGDLLVAKSQEILETASDVFTRGAYLQLISLAANKWVKSYTAVGPVTDQTSLNGLEIAAYYAKGLIMRNENQGYEICESILGLLASDQLGAQAAKVYGVLVCDDPVLSKQNNAVIRLLSKQRFFAFSLPKLVESTNPNNLTSLASLLRYTPSKIITPEIEKFLPPLLEAITLPNPRVQQAAIDTVFATLIESADVLAQRVDTIIPKLLSAKSNNGVNTAGVRAAALRCLSALPDTLPRYVIQPYCQRVINELGESVDDPKRDVRREAVFCRQNYYEM